MLAKKLVAFLMGMSVLQTSSAGEFGMIFSESMSNIVIQAQQFEYKNNTCNPTTGEVSIEVMAGYLSTWRHSNLIIKVSDSQKHWKELVLKIDSGDNTYTINGKTVGIQKISFYKISTESTALVFGPCQNTPK